jgi:hypothetical protein
MAFFHVFLLGSQAEAGFGRNFATEMFRFGGILTKGDSCGLEVSK